MLTAFALIIFTVELQLPTLAPVPGMKLGLANIITVYAVYSFSAGETAMVVAVRVLRQKVPDPDGVLLLHQILCPG